MKTCTIITDGRGAVECPEEQYADKLIEAMGIHPIIDHKEGPTGGYYYWTVPTIADTVIHCLSVEDATDRRLYITAFRWQHDVAVLIAEGMIGLDKAERIADNLNWIEKLRSNKNV